MAIISIDGWKGLTPEQKQEWIRACTDVTVNILKVPLDEVVIYIRDIERDSWGQAGTVGTAPEWLINSRKIS